MFALMLVVAARLLHVLAAALPLAALSAQQTWIVDAAGGPGVQFTEVQPAIFAAAPGDRIQVRGTGVYAGFTIDRGIDVEAVDGAGCTSLFVILVPAGQTATVVGFGAAAPDAIQQVLIADCAGAVLVQDVTANRPNRLLHGLQVTNCPQVWLRSVRIDSVASATMTPSSAPPAAVNIVGSRVVFDSCTLLGAPVLVYSTAARSSPALVIAASFALIDGGVVRGGAGLGWYPCSPFSCCDGPSASPAIGGSGSCVVLGAAQVTGGLGGAGSGGCANSAPAPAFALGGTVQVAPDCLVLPQCAACLGPQLTSLDTLPYAVLGSSVPLSLRGAANRLVVVAGDFTAGVQLVPGHAVPWLLSPACIVLGWVTLSATGQAQIGFSIPNQSALLHTKVFFQALDLAPTTMAWSIGGVTQLHVH